MYPVSDAYKEAITAEKRTVICRIDDMEGNALLEQGGALQTAELEAAANSGDDIVLGSCLCDQLKITALDGDGTLTTMMWDGREIVPYMG